MHRIRYDITSADWEAFGEFHLRNSPTLRNSITRARLIVIAVTIVLTALVWLAMRSTLFLVACLIGGVWGWVTIPESVRKNVQKQMRSMFAENFGDGVEKGNVLEIRDEGLYGESSRGTSTMAWPAITVFDESDSHVYLGLGSVSGLVIPKGRILEGDERAFIDDLRRRLPAASK